MSIRVDGVERAQLDLAVDRRVRFAIGSEAELIEVEAEDAGGSFPLASLLIPFDPVEGGQEAVATSVSLPGGQHHLAIAVVPGQDSAGAEVEIGLPRA
ncbi:MAG: hypothetical protein AAF657_26885 [Acidobacteriota bacterium]